MTGNNGWYWHVHHDRIVEQLTAPVQERIDYIKKNKPKDEIETRLRLLKPVKDQNAVVAARKAYHEAVAAARKAYDEAMAPARKAYDEAVAPARKAYDEAVKSAHAKECPECPWNGRTILEKQ